jgi:hypothetical protein
MKRLAGVVLAIWASLSSGCSFVFVDGPPPKKERGYLRCTESMGWPTVDGVITGLQVVRTLYAASRSDADYEGSGLSRSGDIGFGIALTALFLTSTIVGAGRVNECRDAVEGHADGPPRVDPIMHAIRASIDRAH